ncbi:MAG: hypothetical protein ABEH90_07855 [Halolamina sp.]
MSRQGNGTARRRRLGDDDRGQLVLVAAAVLALALVPLGFAYLQLGYHADVRATSAEESPGSETVRLLERAVHEASGEATGQPWAGRDGAAARVNRTLAADIDAIEAAQVERGIAAEIRQNGTAAATWTDGNCPSGSGREFGACETSGGLVIQERAGETHLVAVAFDVQVVSERGEAELTVVVRAVGGQAPA